MLPLKGPPVAAVKPTLTEEPRTTAIDVDAVFKVRVGNGVTVSA
jgi:hypothetical protein